MKVGRCPRFETRVRARAISSLAGIALLAALGVGAAEAARADGTPSPGPGQLFGVRPVQEGRTTLPGGHFNFALVPGQSITDGIVVENFSGRSLTFHVYGADLLTAAGGGLAPAQSTATMHEAGAWIVVSTPLVTIPAHGQFTDAFTVALPAATSSGQHLGAVVAAADVGLTASGNPIEARTALITVVTVPGTARPSASLSSLFGSGPSSGPIGFGITLLNTGNVLLTYAGSVTVKDGQGRRVAHIVLTPTAAYVVPAGRVALAAVWKTRAPLSETYSARVTVTILADGKPVGTVDSESLALQFPAAMTNVIVAVSALALTAIILLVVRSIRTSRRRRRRITRTAYGTRLTGL